MILDDKVILERIDSNDTGTFGQFTYNNHSWVTCELPWLDDRCLLSCIPKGNYVCSWTFSQRLQKYTYEVKDVPGRTGIRIHSANYPDQLLGCIALGKTIETLNGKKGVFRSKDAIKEFEELMNKKDFKLEIV